MFTTPADETVERRYAAARDQYRTLGVDTETALARLGDVAIALHCWQGDDIVGLETLDSPVDGGGIMATGNYPGRARTGDELRADAEKAFSLIPGRLRFNLHAMYAETGDERADRDQLEPAHFRKWMAWAQKLGISLDFNASYFAHPMANSGYTLSSADEAVRSFWVRHAVACRKIAEAMGRAQGGPCFLNHWLPDGAKDQPVDRWGPRRRLVASLDEMLNAEVDTQYCRDSVEGKLFGIGSEDYVVGSHEFYLGYALTRDIGICLDMGHFHPTETIHDKLSAVLTFRNDIVLHVSRGIRWDSDHIVILNDDVRNVFHELVRGDALNRATVGLDFFDASLNRVGAWVIGTRCTQKAILYALLEPTAPLIDLENSGDMAARLALLEEMKTMPFGAVWDECCRRNGVPVGPAWIQEMQKYDASIITERT